MQLRLMDDIVVPRNLSASLSVPRNLSGSITAPRNMPVSLAAPPNVSAAASHPDRPPYASSNIPKPGAYTAAPEPGGVQQSTMMDLPSPVITKENIIPASMTTTAAAPAPVAEMPAARVTTLVLKSNQVLEVVKYRIDGGQLIYHELNGTNGAVGTEQIDWPRTTQMTAEVRSVDLPVVARQLN